MFPSSSLSGLSVTTSLNIHYIELGLCMAVWKWGATLFRSEEAPRTIGKAVGGKTKGPPALASAPSMASFIIPLPSGVECGLLCFLNCRAEIEKGTNASHPCCAQCVKIMFIIDYQTSTLEMFVS